MPRTRNGRPAEESTPKKTASRGAKATTTKATTTTSKKKPDAAASTPKTPRGKKPSEKNLTMVERVRLAERLVEVRSKERPDTWAAISKREGIPVRTLQHVHSTYVEELRRLGDSTGKSVLDESLLLYGASIEKLAFEAEHGETGAVRVGATRTMLDAIKGRIELLAVMGRMPRSFRAMDELAALQRLTRRLAEVVERHGFSPEIVQEFVQLADEVQPIIEGSATVRALPRAS